jgi:hypothetical protein
VRFHPDWLRRVLRVPYVPTLGPVHPEALSPELFDDVVAASQSGQLLPFDKDQRWSPREDHSVLVAEIIHQPDQTIFPVLSRRAGGVVKTYYYGTSAPDQDALSVATRRWCATYGARAGRVIWFDPITPAAGSTACTRVLLKVFGTDPPLPATCFRSGGRARWLFGSAARQFHRLRAAAARHRVRVPAPTLAGRSD